MDFQGIYQNQMKDLSRNSMKPAWAALKIYHLKKKS